MDIYASHTPPPGFSLFCTQQTAGSPHHLPVVEQPHSLCSFTLLHFPPLLFCQSFLNPFLHIRFFYLVESAVMREIPHQVSGFGMNVLFHSVVLGSRLPCNPLIKPELKGVWIILINPTFAGIDIYTDLLTCRSSAQPHSSLSSPWLGDQLLKKSTVMFVMPPLS